MSRELIHSKVGDFIEITEVTTINKHLYTVGKKYEVIGINKAMTIGQMNCGKLGMVEAAKHGYLQIIADNGIPKWIDPYKKTNRNKWQLFSPANLYVKDLDISSEFVYEISLYLRYFETDGSVAACFDRNLRENEIELVNLLGFCHSTIAAPREIEDTSFLEDFDDPKYLVSAIHKHVDEYTKKDLN